MNKLKTAVILIFILLVGGLGLFIYGCEDDWCYITDWQKARAVDSFELCAGFGFPVMESYPRQCSAGGKTFTEDVKLVPPVEPITYKNLITVYSPLENYAVSSPLKITGAARGNWYFEASFPVRIFDANGKELGVIPAQAKSDWMTTEFVPFEAVLDFQNPTTEKGTLVLQKDNPSGLPEHDDSISIPIRFEKSETKTGTLNGEMTIGPVCPVERVDNPCKPTAEMYAARKVSIYKFTDSVLKNKVLVSTLTPDAEGKFGVTLEAGTYFIDVAHQGLGGVSGVPQTIKIEANKTTALKIDIDTGIR